MFVRKSLLIWVVAPVVLAFVPGATRASRAGDHSLVRGVTISCQTWGGEWADPRFGDELDDLASLGVNWVAIHPYARIHRDGRVTWRTIDPDDPPAYLARPVAAAKKRGMSILVKPHISYWGSKFSWRGEIDFPEADAHARFFADYRRWIVEVAAATRDADAFAVGTELDRLVGHEEEWRGLIADVREVSDAHLTYAANWADFEAVHFWDALDAIGVQAYFPISEADDPSDAELVAGWSSALAMLRARHDELGKPVVFTELGYNCSLDAARRPWAYEVTRGAEAERAVALQQRCMRAALSVLKREEAWLRGAFLWKWFVGEAGRGDGNFLLDTPALRDVIGEAWRPATPTRER